MTAVPAASSARRLYCRVTRSPALTSSESRISRTVSSIEGVWMETPLTESEGGCGGIGDAGAVLLAGRAGGGEPGTVER